jgi:hypothetical protein
VVPPATGASLHYISGVLVTGALQLVDIGGFSDAFSVFRQTMAKDIGDENNIHFFTDGADGLGGLTDVARGANQFGMRITDRVFTNATFLHFVDERTPSKLMIDNADITSQHVNGETHTATR